MSASRVAERMLTPTSYANVQRNATPLVPEPAALIANATNADRRIRVVACSGYAGSSLQQLGRRAVKSTRTGQARGVAAVAANPRSRRELLPR
jgi:hypothetical protein